VVVTYPVRRITCGTCDKPESFVCAVKESGPSHPYDETTSAAIRTVRTGFLKPLQLGGRVLRSRFRPPKTQLSKRNGIEKPLLRPVHVYVRSAIAVSPFNRETASGYLDAACLPSHASIGGNTQRRRLPAPSGRAGWR